ncbi:MAG: crossover junction endodeoxyribonuclease RuvC [Archangium sp.]|nr:crossover junction endodeoxyribonuclease RuvC [Archangium sp.]MDP3155164.1 crossover junction endodeoxyribonuclease RuvC [Archangium sp.]MDP3572520.1 crossover junction endodeoxyribonuclease RuvC [Archangium sp.]
MLVLGIDPGSRYLGYGLVAWRSNKAVHVGSGVVRADLKAPLHQRLSTIFSDLQEVVNVFKPDAVAVEGVFTHKNARSALILGHARGVALLLAAQRGLDVHEYAPARVKKAVGAGGNDSKDAVARMVERLLQLTEPLEREDAYDALAVALCHVNQLRVPRVTGGKTSAGNTFLSRLKPAVVRAAP